MKNKNQTTKKRNYFRKCGECGEKQEQKQMIRTDKSPNGWLCIDCFAALQQEYDEEF